jgi:hypothetical protein
MSILIKKNTQMTNIEELLTTAVNILQEELAKKNRSVARTKHLVKTAAKLVQIPTGEEKSELSERLYRKTIAELAEKDAKNIR